MKHTIATLTSACGIGAVILSFLLLWWGIHYQVLNLHLVALCMLFAFGGGVSIVTAWKIRSDDYV